MARVVDNVVTRGTSGAIGKKVVFRIFNKKTFMSKYPDMSQVIRTLKQVSAQKIFALAAKFASDIIHDPVKKAAYTLGDRSSVYHAAIEDFMEAWKAEHGKIKDSTKDLKYLESFNMNERQLKAVKYLMRIGKLTNNIYQQVTGVSKPTATRDLQWLVQQKIIKGSNAKGAGAVYRFIGDMEEIIGSGGK